MPITTSDIKLLASERMTDTSDGGGRRTSNVIPDGVPGNIFPKVSRLDSVYGRWNARKVYGQVSTPSLDVYAGAHAIVMDGPDNNKIHVCIFSTASEFDDRTAARDRVESYVIAGPESRMFIYGRQLVGQMAVTVYQREEDPLPEVGQVFSLSREVAGVVTNQQYIRIEDLDHEVRTFTTEQNVSYKRRIITMQTSTPLRYEYAGVENPALASAVERTVKVRNTTVADASRYFGLQPLVEPANENDLLLKVASIYTPIVPTTQRETAVADAQLGGAHAVEAASTTYTPWLLVTNYQGTSEGGTGALVTRTFTLPRGVKPGTLRAKLTGFQGLGTGETTVAVDDGFGVIGTAPGPQRIIHSGTIDYETGAMTLVGQSVTQFGTLAYVQFVPAVDVSQPAHTQNIKVTLASRSSVYIRTLNPLPSPGTAFLDFRALGKWYRLRDDGTGVLAGDDPAYGTGTVNYITGTIVVTLGALPDVGSEILLAWGSPVHYTIRANGTSDARATASQEIQLSDLPVRPGTLTVKYLGAAVEYTGTANEDGVISGGGITGTVDHATGLVQVFYSTRLPNQETTVTLSYDRELPPEGPGPTPAASGSSLLVAPLVFDTAPNVAPRGMAITFPVAFVHSSATDYFDFQAADDGTGNMVTLPRYLRMLEVEYRHAGGTVVATVDYATGTVTMNGTPVVASSAVYAPGSYNFSYGTITGAEAEWTLRDKSLPPSPGTYSWQARFDLEVEPEVETLTQVADPLNGNPIKLSLTNTITSAIEPGSLTFSAFGYTHIDLGGFVYRRSYADSVINPTVDYISLGDNVGEINYATGEVTLNQWVNNTAVGLSVKACLTKFGDWTATGAAFRTAGSPIRPSSGFVQVVATDGDVLTATSNDAGDLTGAYARGEINQQTGVVWIEWGEMVAAAGNELEEWYDPTNVVGSNVWRPREVFPSTIRYNAVVLSNLPLNAEILGLDPIRLPSDGRVPIYRGADVVVIHNTKNLELPNPAVAGATYDADRTVLSEGWLLDAAGARVASSKYAVNLAAGTVTMAADLDLTGVPQPLKFRHRIEELNLLSDVQINGQLSLTGPLSRDFDEDSFVSSALLFGDMFARVTGVFDQVTFTGVWSDSRIGSNATGEYNTVDYPIEVLNNGAVTERWRINFTSGGAYQVIGENLGVIATGTTAADCAPVNTLTGQTYFILRAAGWGAGWAAQNNLRFNTIGATAPIWAARTVLPGATINGDRIDVQLRGDVDE